MVVVVVAAIVRAPRATFEKLGAGHIEVAAVDRRPAAGPLRPVRRRARRTPPTGPAPASGAGRSVLGLSTAVFWSVLPPPKKAWAGGHSRAPSFGPTKTLSTIVSPAPHRAPTSRSTGSRRRGCRADPRSRAPHQSPLINGVRRRLRRRNLRSSCRYEGAVLEEAAAAAEALLAGSTVARDEAAHDRDAVDGARPL